MANTRTRTMSSRLSEEHVSDAFHTYLKSSLAQARSQRLLDAQVLASAEADIMVTGPALCLYFAALRCTTSPPSVPLPRSGKDTDPNPNPNPIDLTADNCPRPFIGFMETWALSVPLIQSLAPEYQHDLARIICGLGPMTTPLHPGLSRIAAELRAIAIEISQRRSFQDRYASDLQAALDTVDGGRRRVASFVPPPMYDPSPSSSASPSPNSQTVPLPPRTSSPFHSEFLSPTAPLRLSSPKSGSRSHSRTRSRTPSPAPSSSFSPPPSPSFAADAPSIQLIRETLYASLADVIARHRHIRKLLKRDPPRAYFSAVALAILDVASTRTHIVSSSNESGNSAEPEIEVEGVLGAKLSLAACPPPLRPFMRELGMIGAAVREAEEEDTAVALEALSSDTSATLPTPRMERVRRMLERGIGAELRKRHSSEPAISTDDEDEDDDDDDTEDEEPRRQSVEGRAIVLANRINALALGMTKLRAFRDRQNEIFKVLAGVAS